MLLMAAFLLDAASLYYSDGSVPALRDAASLHTIYNESHLQRVQLQVRLRAPVYNEQFLLHLLTRSKQAQCKMAILCPTCNELGYYVVK